MAGTNYLSESEEYLLSCCLMDREHFFKAASSGITEANFSDFKRKDLWKAIVETAAHGGNTGPEEVRLYFPKFSQGELYLLQGKAPTSQWIDKHIDKLVTARRKATVCASLKAAVTQAESSADSFEDFWASVFPHVDAAINTCGTVKHKTLAESCEEYKAEVQNPQIKRTVTTGWKEVDEDFGTPKAGEMIVVAARPGCGKSTLALQMAYAASVAGKRVLFFSLEMGAVELIERLVLNQGGRRVKMDSRAACVEADKIAKQTKRLSIFDNSEAKQTFSDIETRCRSFASLDGGIDVIFVDYLGIIEADDDDRKTREQQVAKLSRSFKRLAGVLKCPIYVLSQMNREIEKDGKPRAPRLSDLRESGSIEQDADRVWFLAEDPDFMNSLATSEMPNDVIIRLMQAKCRGGKSRISVRMNYSQDIFRMWPVETRRQ